MNNDLRLMNQNHKSSIINHKSDFPKAYQKGYVEFFKLKFAVTPDVLIPRPETELLVEETIKYVSSEQPTTNHFTILDLGTGSGCIAISLAISLDSHPRGGIVNIIATDISDRALKVAKANAKFHHVEDNIIFIQSNLLDFLNSQHSRRHLPGEQCGHPDIIVTNLPYIPSARIPYLDSSVKDFEPWVALDGGEDGFDLYRKLFQQLQKKNVKPKLIVSEIDYTQGEIAINEAQKYFPEAFVEVKLDLTHKQRILKIVG